MFDVFFFLNSPICDAWYGGKMIADKPDYFAALSVTKDKYNECGVDYVLRLLNPC